MLETVTTVKSRFIMFQRGHFVEGTILRRFGKKNNLYTMNNFDVKAIWSDFNLEFFEKLLFKIVRSGGVLEGEKAKKGI